MEAMDWWQEERIAWAEGYRCIVGVDEVGRGALAGPVVAACVVLPYETVPPGINDSKALTPVQRVRLHEWICAQARGIGIGIVEAPVIDEINILRAAHQAMRQALENLPGGLWPDLALIDGLPVRPFPLPQVAIVRGDCCCASIAAASIVAKVTRDRLMQAVDSHYPGYGFSLHKGYAAPLHLRALAEMGPCPLHRRSFRPVAENDPADLESRQTQEPKARKGKRGSKRGADSSSG